MAPTLAERVGRPILETAGRLVGPFLVDGPLVPVYHGVGVGDHDIAVSEADFEAHLDHVEASGYEPMTLSTFFERGRPDDAVVFTFDDGTAGQRRAADRMAERGIPAVFFLTVDFVGREGYATWDDVRSLPECHEIGAHTMTHPDLGACTDPAELDAELVDGRDRLEAECGRDVTQFAIPYGKPANLSPEAGERLREAGYEGISSTTGYLPGRYRRLDGPGEGSRWLVERTPINGMDPAVFGALMRSGSLPGPLLREAIRRRGAGDRVAARLSPPERSVE